MQKTQIVTHLLVPADQYPSEAIHPTMGAFDDPPSRLETCLVLERLRLFSSCPDVGGEAKLVQEVSDFVIVIALIQAQPLRRVGSRVWALCSDTLNGLARHLKVIAVRPVHCEADGHAMAVGEHAALGARFPAIRRILAHLFPPREALWSSPRPSPAMPSQSLAGRHMPSAPFPISLRRRPPPPTLGSGDGPNSWSRYRWRSAHSTGILSGARKKWHPSLCGHQHEADGTPTGGASVLGAAPRCVPTTHQGCANRHRRPGGACFS